MEVVLAYARTLGGHVSAALAAPGVRVEVAGGLRRAEEVVTELVLVIDRAPSEVERTLRELASDVVHETASLRGFLPLEIGPMPMRIRCASERGFVEALLRETGSRAHVEALEQRAHERGTTLGELAHGARDERAVYEALDLPFVPPELRDRAGLEPEAGVVERVRGVLHVHTTWSDGRSSVADMARAAQAAGFEYVGISDHSRAASYAHGLDIERLGRQRDAVQRAREEVPGITILHGIEVDILPDGALDLPDPVLGRLDFVVASVHSDLSMEHDAMTRRIVRAIEHPLVDVLGHPTGRLLGGRDPIAFDFDTVAATAARTGTWLEINTSATRLDLSADLAERAAAFGASFCIDPDAHETRAFETVEDGVLIARRARLPQDRVLNTRGSDEFREALSSRRARHL